MGLKVGDIFAAGETYGKVRTLISTNDGKTRLNEVGPSVPVRIVGFEGVPSAGDSLVVVEDEQTARTLAESRRRISREKSSNLYQNNLMDSISLTFGAQKESRYMYVLVKSDVKGTAEALTRSLQELKLENEEAVVTVKRYGDCLCNSRNNSYRFQCCSFDGSNGRRSNAKYSFGILQHCLRRN